MAEIKISEKLGEKLGEKDTKKISFLAKFEEEIKNKMEISNCPDNVMEAIVDKVTKLTEVVAKISNINSQHISNDAKKEKIQKELGNIDLSEFLNSLNEEITATKATLLSKGTELNKSMKEKSKEILAELEKFVTENIGLLDGRLVDVKKKREGIKKKIGEINHETSGKTSLTQTKAPGFFETFKRMRKEGKEDKSKRMGFFKTVKQAYLETKLNKKDEKENAVEDIKSKLVELYDKKDELYNKLHECEKNMAEIEKQKTEWKKQIGQVEEAIKEVTYKLEQLISEKQKEIGKGEVKKEDTEEVIEETRKMVIKNARDNKKKKELDFTFKEIMELAGVFVFGHLEEWGEKIGRSLDNVEEKYEENKLKRLEEKIQERDDDLEKFKSYRHEAVEKISDERDNYKESKSEYEKAKNEDINSKNKNIEKRVAKKLIRGISDWQKKMSEKRYKKTVRKAMKRSEDIKTAEKKLKEATDKYIKYDKKSKRNSEVREKRRKAREEKGMDR